MIQLNPNHGNCHYWEYLAKDVAEQNDEGCKHLCEYLPKVTFKYDTKPGDEFYLRFRVKCGKCKERFYRTEALMRKMFIESHKMNYIPDMDNDHNAQL